MEKQPTVLPYHTRYLTLKGPGPKPWSLHSGTHVPVRTGYAQLLLGCLFWLFQPFVKLLITFPCFFCGLVSELVFALIHIIGIPLWIFQKQRPIVKNHYFIIPFCFSHLVMALPRSDSSPHARGPPSKEIISKYKKPEAGMGSPPGSPLRRLRRTDDNNAILRHVYIIHLKIPKICGQKIG